MFFWNEIDFVSALPKIPSHPSSQNVIHTTLFTFLDDDGGKKNLVAVVAFFFRKSIPTLTLQTRGVRSILYQRKRPIRSPEEDGQNDLYNDRGDPHHPEEGLLGRALVFFYC